MPRSSTLEKTPTPRPDPVKAAAHRATIRVLVVDDHPMMRRAVRELINHEIDMEVCGEADNQADTLRLITEKSPHVILLDLSLGEEQGLDLLKEIITLDASQRILVLSMHDQEVYAERVLRAGARGYLNKRETPETILAAIRNVMEGRIAIDSRATQELLGRITRKTRGSANGVIGILSDREMQTFELIGQGLPSRVIAARLNVSIKTIEVYRERIKVKLGISSAAALVHRAVEWTLTGA